MSKYNRGYPKSRFVSDRSGFTFSRSQMTKEPGTGLIVARSESDGKWSLTEHPQSKPAKWKPERMGLKDPRPQNGRYKDTYLVNDWTHSELPQSGPQWYEFDVPLQTEEGSTILVEGYDPP